LFNEQRYSEEKVSWSFIIRHNLMGQKKGDHGLRCEEGPRTWIPAAERQKTRGEQISAKGTSRGSIQKTWSAFGGTGAGTCSAKKKKKTFDGRGLESAKVVGVQSHTLYCQGGELTKKKNRQCHASRTHARDTIAKKQKPNKTNNAACLTGEGTKKNQLAPRRVRSKEFKKKAPKRGS